METNFAKFRLEKNNKVKISVSLKGKILIDVTQVGFKTMHGILKFIHELLPEYKKQSIHIQLENLNTGQFVIAEYRMPEKRIPNQI